MKKNNESVIVGLIAYADMYRREIFPTNNSHSKNLQEVLERLEKAYIHYLKEVDGIELPKVVFGEIEDKELDELSWKLHDGFVGISNYKKYHLTSIGKVRVYFSKARRLKGKSFDFWVLGIYAKDKKYLGIAYHSKHGNRVYIAILDPEKIDKKYFKITKDNKLYINNLEGLKKYIQNKIRSILQ